ncbi:unnamed protein product, partial [Rotaria sordida]
MLVQPINNNGDGPDGGATGPSASIPWAIAILAGIILSAFAIVVILSLIPVYLRKAGANLVTDQNTETGDITRTFVTNTILANNQSATVVNFNQIARQIEAAYRLPAGS